MAYYMAVGSFGKEKGLRTYRIDPEVGEIEYIGGVLPEVNVGCALYDGRRELLYVTNESSANPDFRFGGGGELYALRFDRETGRLDRMDRALSYGSHPTYLALDRTGERLVVTHFAPSAFTATTVVRNENGRFTVKPVLSDSNTVLHSLREDGSFEKVLDVLTHPVEEGFRENPHLHCVKPSPLYDFLAVCDTGTDKIYLMRSENGRLTPEGNTPLQLTEDVGPRYCAFHPTQPLLFVNCERRPLVKSFRYTGEGTLMEVCTAWVLPEEMGERADFNPSDLAISADGRFLYCLVRGANAVSVLEADGQTGRMCPVQCYQLNGRGPRGCALTPDGRYLAVANKDSGSVELLKVREDGALESFGGFLAPSPGVVAFMEGKDGSK